MRKFTNEIVGEKDLQVFLGKPRSEQAVKYKFGIMDF